MMSLNSLLPGNLSKDAMAVIQLRAKAEQELRRRKRLTDEAKEDSAIIAARNNMLAFTEFTFPGYDTQWFHKLICEELDHFYQDVVDGRSPRLMIFAPPRHGKTELVSRRFPAYAFGVNPDISIISASYASDLASRNNRDVQRIIDDRAYSILFPETYLSGKNVKTAGYSSFLRNSELFEIVGHKGTYRAAGVGTGITGMGADVLIIDDPIKDAEQAYSQVYRNKVWEWYTTTAYTRLMPGGGILIILTRWHEDDLAGKLLEKNDENGDVWKILSFPAIAESDDEFRSAGDALYPGKYDLQRLMRYKSTLPSKAWASLYQQRPQVEGGGLFKNINFRYFTTDNNVCVLRDGEATNYIQMNSLTIFTTMDLAARTTEKSDYTVIGVWGLTRDSGLILLDLIRERLEGAAHLDLVWAVHNKWNPAEHNIESVQYQITLIQQARNAGLPVKELKTGMKDKYVRALSAAAKIEGHKVYFPANAPWLSDLEDELVSFPNGRHDDIVDVVAYAAIRAADIGEIVLPKLPAMQSSDRFVMPKILKSY
ncbi:hypothetical protein EG832_03550 [bacterium]|nr:hypothetical protein [bacterium]